VPLSPPKTTVGREMLKKKCPSQQIQSSDEKIQSLSKSYRCSWSWFFLLTKKEGGNFVYREI
jgi:hypothetical protein